jgi:hypothetical protein
MPTNRDQEEQDLRIEVMQQDLKLKEKQTRWETWKALAMILLAAAAIAASARLADWIYQPRPQTIIIQQQPPAH